ncbi:MAG: valine--tRNA ligase [Spirochaetes bacterium]|nr:valine--tRNA ligase [Spirochaetota bacterium]
MEATQLEKSYDPKTFEERIYSMWIENGAFNPDALPSQEGSPFVVVIPPPNVTGVLHLGHGLNNALQDIVIRYHRMAGRRALWVPGTDHAGIATQNVVERRLKETGKSRHDLGREKFVEETWKVKEEHHTVISSQLARIGSSVDWSRERFTLDEGLSKAVREVFVTLYERDLLYKGNYLVNWCASCGTALSDDEVDHEEIAGKMYHIKYYLEGETGDAPKYIEIATTRPETLLGDVAVAVNPEDERYLSLKGKNVILPIAGRSLPVIFDQAVDKAFGTGALKITPAHDPADWEAAGRHSLPALNILNPDGTLNDEVPEKYRGLSVKQARSIIVEDLKAGGWFVKEEAITHAVGHCYRCATVIEPFLSKQWFVKMKPLAEKALASWRRGDFVFYPKRWENTFERWLSGIRDWCISRQIWWGHRIPAWDCAACGKISVSRADISACIHCGSAEIEQDSDVLDTWFSSWLWPFSVFGWPEKTADLEKYYPTQALVTAYDIIFFWVARMIMAGLEFTGKAPFADIYITGLVRDKQGRKMSKSLGNGFDPLEVVDESGADALKFTLAFLCAQGQDVLVDKDDFKLGSKFANKIWNASRYILMNLEGRKFVENPPLSSIDKWIYSRLNGAAKTAGDAFLSYRFNEAAAGVYEYFWNDFCDWYVEATKLSFKGGDEGEKDRAASVLLLLLAESLKLLHPLLPFVTEEIYGKLPAQARGGGGGAACGAGLLITAGYPKYEEGRFCRQAEEDFAALQSLVGMVRTMRGECGIGSEKKLPLQVRAEEGRGAAFTENAELIKMLAGCAQFKVEAADAPFERPPGAIGMAGAGFEVFALVGDAVDTAALKKKFEKELERDAAFAKGLGAKLENEQFLKNAPPALVAAEKVKLEESRKRREKLKSYLKDL